MNVLVIDIGGTHVKVHATNAAEARFDSNNTLTPGDLVTAVRRATGDWRYDVVSIGYPGAVDEEGPSAEPGNLGLGWIRFDFGGGFNCPVRIVNDAAMQALGGYDGGRMLFLGLGTGLGSTLISERVIVPLELGCLLDGRGGTLVGSMGREGLERQGEEEWRRAVRDIVPVLREAFAADYMVLGGGNAKLVDPLPEDARWGGSDDAFTGGFRLWEELVEPHDRTPSGTWRVVR